MATRYQAHRKKWIDCTACPLHQGRTQVVLARGHLPADILFVGEAPGASEDVLGRPFVGPAGHLLDSIVDQALDAVPGIGVAFTNLVACIPKTGATTAKIGEPPAQAIQACNPRLLELIDLCHPQLIVGVGVLATKHLEALDSSMVMVISIVHPAAILRMDISQRGLAIQRATIALEDAATELVPF